MIQKDYADLSKMNEKLNIYSELIYFFLHALKLPK